MEFLGDIWAIAVILGASELATACAWGVPPAVLRLASLPLLALVAEALVSLQPGGLVTPVPAALEFLGPHPLLAPLGSALAAGGCLRFAWRLRRGGLGPGGWLMLVPSLLLPACWLPPWAVDTALYHLSLPVHRLLGHEVIAGHGNGGFFSLGESTTLWPLAQGSVAAARSLQLWVLAWACQACWALLPGVRIRTALLAQCLFVASPVVLWQLGCGYVDVWMSAYEAVALLLLLRWQLGARTKAQAPQLILSAWLCGAAAATKALALSDVFLWLLAAAADLRGPKAKQANPTPARAWLVAAGALLGPPAFYLVRNLLRYHAPLFPFMAAWWPGEAFGLLEGQRTTLLQFLDQHGPQRNHIPQQGLAALLALPWALTFDAAFASPRFDGVLGALPALAALLAGVRAWRRRQRRSSTPAAAALLRLFVQVLCATRLLLWLTSSWQARFLLTPLWWCCWALAAGSLQALAAATPPAPPSSWPSFGANVARSVGLLLLSLSFWPTLRGHGPTFDRRAFAAAPARRQLRLQVLAPTRLCDAPWTTLATQTDLVWTQRSLLWCLGPVHSDSYDEAATLRTALQAVGNDPWQVVARLEALGIGEILVDEALWRWQAPALDTAGRRAHALEQAAWQRLRQVALEEVGRVGEVARYRLRPPK